MTDEMPPDSALSPDALPLTADEARQALDRHQYELVEGDGGLVDRVCITCRTEWPCEMHAEIDAQLGRLEAAEGDLD
jgi:hypothetical protein